MCLLLPDPQGLYQTLALHGYLLCKQYQFYCIWIVIVLVYLICVPLNNNPMNVQIHVSKCRMYGFLGHCTTRRSTSFLAAKSSQVQGLSWIYFLNLLRFSKLKIYNEMLKLDQIFKFLFIFLS